VSSRVMASLWGGVGGEHQKIGGILGCMGECEVYGGAKIGVGFLNPLSETTFRSFRVNG